MLLGLASGSNEEHMSHSLPIKGFGATTPVSLLMLASAKRHVPLAVYTLWIDSSQAVQSLYAAH